ncbi:MAG: acetyl-CoA hydrolase/transferase family protein [Steroidobacteraceae bacterium]
MKLVERELADLDLAEFIRAGDGLVWGQAAAEPSPLTEALVAQRHALGPIEAFIGATWSTIANPQYADTIRFRSYCATAGNRALAKARCLQLVREPYSRLGELFRTGELKADVLMLQATQDPDTGHLMPSLALDYLIPAMERARVCIVEVNDRAPVTYGAPVIPAELVGCVVRTSREPLGLRAAPASDAIRAVARQVASLIEDGCTLQFGIGSLPEAVLSELYDRRDLGIHSGAFVDEAARLSSAGVVTNARKTLDAGVSVVGVAMGGRRACEFIHDNRQIRFASTDYTHAADVLAQIDDFTAINAAIEVDLTGQVNAELAAGAVVGAVGGAPDFLAGAMRARGGRAIVALPSTAGEGEKRVSRIVASLNGPVSTTRESVGFVVTEHGVADLRGASQRERRDRLISVASPEFRESLRQAAEGDT